MYDHFNELLKDVLYELRIMRENKDNDDPGHQFEYAEAEANAKCLIFTYASEDDRKRLYRVISIGYPNLLKYFPKY